MKGCGKSAPGVWQQKPHGKPHREQDQIGMTRGNPACFEAMSSGLVARACRQRPPQMNGHHVAKAALQNPAYRSTGVDSCPPSSLNDAPLPPNTGGHTLEPYGSFFVGRASGDHVALRRAGSPPWSLARCPWPPLII